MDLKQEFAKTPKEFIINRYLSLAYDYEGYDNIARIKLVDKFIKKHTIK